MSTPKELGKWKCVETGEVEGVTNGMSPTIGPCQTIPLDDVARKIAGLPIEQKEQTEEVPE